MKKWLKRLLALVLVVALIAGSVTGYKYWKSKNAKAVKIYSVAELAETDYWMDSAESYGSVRSDKTQSIFVSPTQKVEEIKVQEGQNVKKGDVLMTYDTTLSKIEVEKQELELRQMQQDLEKYKSDLAKVMKYKPGKKIPPKDQVDVDGYTPPDRDDDTMEGSPSVPVGFLTIDMGSLPQYLTAGMTGALEQLMDLDSTTAKKSKKKNKKAAKETTTEQAEEETTAAKKKKKNSKNNKTEETSADVGAAPEETTAEETTAEVTTPAATVDEDQVAADRVSALIAALPTSISADAPVKEEKKTDETEESKEESGEAKESETQETEKTEETKETRPGTRDQQTLNDWAVQIRNARIAYDDLTVAQQKKVSHAMKEKLVTAENQIAVALAEKAILDLPDTVEAKDETIVIGARKLYNDLTKGQRKLVRDSLLQKLTKAEEQVKAAKAEATAPQETSVSEEPGNPETSATEETTGSESEAAETSGSDTGESSLANENESSSTDEGNKGKNPEEITTEPEENSENVGEPSTPEEEPAGKKKFSLRKNNDISGEEESTTEVAENNENPASDPTEGSGNGENQSNAPTNEANNGIEEGQPSTEAPETSAAAEESSTEAPETSAAAEEPSTEAPESTEAAEESSSDGEESTEAPEESSAEEPETDMTETNAPETEKPKESSSDNEGSTSAEETSEPASEEEETSEEETSEEGETSEAESESIIEDPGYPELEGGKGKEDDPYIYHWNDNCTFDQQFLAYLTQGRKKAYVTIQVVEHEDKEAGEEGEMRAWFTMLICHESNEYTAEILILSVGERVYDVRKYGQDQGNEETSLEETSDWEDFPELEEASKKPASGKAQSRAKLRLISGQGSRKNPYLYAWNQDLVLTQASMKNLSRNQKSIYENILILEPDDTEESPSAFWNMKTGFVRGDYIFRLLKLGIAGDEYDLTAFNEETTEDPDETEESTYDPYDPDGPGDDSVTYTREEIAEMRSTLEQSIRDLDLELRIAQVELERKQKELDSGEVLCTVDGVIATVRNQDEAQAENKPLIEVSGGGGYYISGSVSELELNSVAPGQTIEITSYESGSTCEGEVTEVSDMPNTGDFYDGMGNSNVSYYPFQVFVQEGSGLRDGEYVELKYEKASANTDSFYLINSMFRKDKGTAYVYKRGKGGALVKQKIRTGKSIWGEYTEILAGITLDDMIAFPYGDEVVEGAQTERADSSELYEYY